MTTCKLRFHSCHTYLTSVSEVVTVDRPPPALSEVEASAVRRPPKNIQRIKTQNQNGNKTKN